MLLPSEAIVAALVPALPEELVSTLVADYLTLRQDTATKTLGRATPGKFVESFVQILQVIETGQYEKNPSIDQYLRNVESRTGLNDGLRICAARAARTMYSLRNKRNIAHKGQLDPNATDLAYLHHTAQWIMTELIRTVANIPIEQAAKLIARIQLPITDLVEDFDGRKVVLTDLAVREELLVVLQGNYPERVPLKNIKSSMNRRAPATIEKAVRRLWKAREVEGDGIQGYVLTQRGYATAAAIIAQHIP